MRITNSFPVALFLVVACQWNGGSKLSEAPGRMANTQPNIQSTAQPNTQASANAPELLSLIASVAPTTSATFSDADYARHVQVLRSKIKKKVTESDRRAAAAEFSIVIQQPFVVIGDETKEA